MAVPRSSMRAFRQITPASRRCLHITGVNSAQPANVEDPSSVYGARSESDLQQECQRRTLATSGTKSELVERLSNNDVLQSRAFSIAMRRINGNAFSEYVELPDGNGLQNPCNVTLVRSQWLTKRLRK